MAIYSPLKKLTAIDDDSGSALPAGPGRNALIENITLDESGGVFDSRSGARPDTRDETPSLETDTQTGAKVVRYNLDAQKSRGPYEILVR